MKGNVEMSNPHPGVYISLEEYLQLKDDSEVLTALYNAGVDNWEGYSYAMESIDGTEEDS